MSLNIQVKFTGVIIFVGSLGNEIKAQYEKNHWPCGKPARMHTALNDLTALRRRRVSVRIKVSNQIFSPNLKTTMQLMVMRVKVQVTEHDLLIELVYSV